MKLVWFLLVVVQAAIGGLALLRFGDRMLNGGGGTQALIQLAIGLVFLFGAWQTLKRARSAR